MLAVKRIEKIKEMLLEYKQVEITSLTNILAVSEATIRRDLEKLESENFSKRTHGGAVLIEPKESVSNIDQNNIRNYEEKRLVGYISSQLVDDNDVIFIGAGSTCNQLATHLKNKKNLTIVTNNIDICSIVANQKHIKVILTGGELYYSNRKMSMLGDFANKMLTSIYVSKAFFSVDGIDFDYGYSIIGNEFKLIWDIVSRNCDELIIISDYTKFSKKAFVKLSDLSAASKIVTNEKVPEAYKAYFFEHDIPIYTSYNLQSGLLE